ncbi:MAG TPA: neutral zinc metallopeptidase [Mycobacteriales bacterium]|nr:neutral zinc metallopeptidase [Mycobacteriales bacterium]
MSGKSWRIQIAALAALSVLASGCAQVVDGRGTYSSGLSDVPDAKVQIEGSDNSKVDKIAGNAIADIQAFWTQQMPAAFGKPYKPVSKFFSIDPGGSKSAPCTTSPSDIRGNAFYCPTQDIVAWDRVKLFPELEKQFGPFLIAMVLAHEWGHAIQRRTEMPSNRTIVVEAQADCYAGSWTKTALTAGAPHFQINREDLDQALSGYLLFRDPVGASADDRQAHGSGFDRISAFQEGYEQGVKHCSTYSDKRVFTEIPFTSTEDQQRNGNLPFDQTLTDGPKDLADFWAQSFEATFGKKFNPVAHVTGYDPDGDRPSCDGTQVAALQYCPADDTIYFDKKNAMQKVYDKTGDFGPMSLFGVAYGEAIRRRLGKTVNGEDALLGSICLSGAYAGAVFKRRPGDKGIVLSPGDLDEAIQALLNFAGSSGLFDANGTVGFDRVAAYRKGFNSVKNCA